MYTTILNKICPLLFLSCLGWLHIMRKRKTLKILIIRSKDCMYVMISQLQPLKNHLIQKQAGNLVKILILERGGGSLPITISLLISLVIFSYPPKKGGGGQLHDNSFFFICKKKNLYCEKKQGGGQPPTLMLRACIGRPVYKGRCEIVKVVLTCLTQHTKLKFSVLSLL